MTHRSLCPTPRKTRTGELECSRCGRTVEADANPYCGHKPSGSDRRTRTRDVAQQELRAIREGLTRTSANPPNKYSKE